ncbi:NAD(P)-dependent oxidoreductase [Thalassococcus profundi]|uniref:NAD(P)-dependent oxidoreductase n=1 Tax=Thalassococcus profundi TaxID=2282382 RepID=A0A369TKS1_9RHOB|nr:DUF1932 domain-containing protein [Thalassococcus profundi]RDD65858.1 NAD(P)-dependent oxidoreductase [Thalassococcus profundi]
MSVTESTQDIVLIGFGEVGRAFGVQIESTGITSRYVDPVAHGTHGSRNVSAALPSPMQSGTLVLGAVPSAAATAVARDLATRDESILYVDLTSSPQGLMRDCAALFDTRPSDFVDGAIMGSVDLSGSGAPVLLSGPAADRACAALSTLGFSAKALPASQAGDACGVKLLRTLMTKGIEALAVECFAAARGMGLEEELRANLSDIGARPFPSLLDAMVRTHMIHAPRRQHEVEAAIGQARSLGLKTPVTDAVLVAYRQTARRIDSERPPAPGSVAEAVSWLAGSLR